MSISIFIFRRDFRIIDNTSLQILLKSKDKILPIFIFNKKQIDRNINKYYSENCVEFMFQSLKEISPINYYYTTNDDITILNELKRKFNIGTIAFNKDYTPFAKKRESMIEKLCKQNNISFFKFEDHMLTGVDAVKKLDGGLYSVFTPYYRAGMKLKKREPVKNHYKNYISKNTTSLLINISTINHSKNISLSLYFSYDFNIASHSIIL